MQKLVERPTLTELPVIRGHDRGVWLAALALPVLAVLGGGNALYSLHRMGAELIGLVILIAACWRLSPSRFWHQDRMAALLLSSLLVLLVAQLIPLPSPWWAILPGRALAVQGDMLMFGALPARAISLDPEATLRAALMLLPAMAFYLFARTAGHAGRQVLLWSIVGVALCSAVMGLIQITTGHAAWSHIYINSQSDLPTGFFANRNHQALLMVMALSLLGAGVAESDRLRAADGRDPASTMRWRALAFSAGSAPLVIGALVTGSRTGALLLLPALLGGTLIALRVQFADRRRVAIIVGLLATIAVVLGAAIAWSGGPLARLAERSLGGDDSRLRFWPQVIEVLKGYYPVGSGFGTFRAVYDAAESNRVLGPLYLNHAHNDWLEIALEGGLPATMLIAGFLLWFARKTREAVRATVGITAIAVPQAAALAITCILLHSMVDYPLRTITLATVCALCLAFLTPIPVKSSQA